MRQLDDEPKKLTLRQWMKKNKMSVSQLCRLIGCCETTVLHWKNGKFIPHKLHKFLIKKITNGEVEI